MEKLIIVLMYSGIAALLWRTVSRTTISEVQDPEFDDECISDVTTVVVVEERDAA